MKGYLKSASSVKTGKKFYESRLAKNYSIDDVAEILYINKDYVIQEEILKDYRYKIEHLKNEIINKLDNPLWEFEYEISQ